MKHLTKKITATVLCLIIFGAEYFIVPALAFIAAELMLLRKKLDKTAKEAKADDDK